VTSSVLSSGASSLLHAILAQGRTQPTNAELATLTGVSPRGLAYRLASLRAAGLVETGPTRLGPGLGLVLSIALSSRTCRAALVDANGATVGDVALPPVTDQRKLPPDQLLDRVAEAARLALARSRHDCPELATDDGRIPLIGVATAWPAPIRGSLRSAGMILHPEWASRRETLPEAVARRLGVPVDKTHAINDGNAHALAVVFDKSRARAHENDETTSRISLVLRVGGGLSASTMIVAPHRRERLAFISSTMLGGARSLAGELAHFPIEQSVLDTLNGDGRWIDHLSPLSSDSRCSCGQTGHLEAFASGTAFKRRMDESGVSPESLDSRVYLNSIRDADRALAEVEDQRLIGALEDMGRLIGRSLTGPILLLDPHTLTLTGSFALKPVFDGLIAERGTWRHVFGDALTIDRAIDVADGDSRLIGVRGAGLAVIRQHVHRRFEAIASDLSQLPETFSL